MIAQEFSPIAGVFMHPKRPGRMEWVAREATRHCEQDNGHQPQQESMIQAVHCN